MMEPVGLSRYLSSGGDSCSLLIFTLDMYNSIFCIHKFYAFFSYIIIIIFTCINVLLVAKMFAVSKFIVMQLADSNSAMYYRSRFCSYATTMVNVVSMHTNGNSNGRGYYYY